MKKIFYLSFIFATSLFITSCDKDDDHDHDDHNHNNNTVVAPDTYSFERGGISTVSYSGQTCRLQMAKDIYDALNSIDPGYLTTVTSVDYKGDMTTLCALGAP